MCITQNALIIINFYAFKKDWQVSAVEQECSAIYIQEIGKKNHKT